MAAVSEAVVSGWEDLVDSKVSWSSGVSVWNSGLLVLNLSAEQKASALLDFCDLLGWLGAADSVTDFVCDALKLRFLPFGSRSAWAEKKRYFLGSSPLPLLTGVWSRFTEWEKSGVQRTWGLLIRVFCSCSCRSIIFSGLLSLLLGRTQVLAEGPPGHWEDLCKLSGSGEDFPSVSGCWNVKVLCPLASWSGPLTESEGWNDDEDKTI